MRKLDPEIAATAYGFAAAQSIVEGDLSGARRQAELAVEVAGTNELSSAAHDVAAQALGTALILTGDPRGADTLRQTAREMLTRDDLTGREYLALPLIWIEEYGLAWQLLGPRLDEVRSKGDVRALTASLEVDATLCFRTGNWTRALASAAESAGLARESSQTVQLAYSLATLAIVQAGQGDDDASESADQAAALGAQFGLAELEQYVGTAIGLLELGRGDPDAALAGLDRAAAYAHRAAQREVGVHQWMADLLDAAFLTKDLDRVQLVIDELMAIGSRPWARAVAWRGVGMLAGAGGYASAFAEALGWHDRTAAPFEQARLHLWWGRRLRRDRQRVEARAHLTPALEVFERLHARPWVLAARRELTASGERLRRADEGREMLTPQEAQISALVAAGASNKDIAGTMYLSPKTVESHLSRIYRKLGVRTRQQLIVQLLGSNDERLTAVH